MGKLSEEDAANLVAKGDALAAEGPREADAISAYTAAAEIYISLLSEKSIAAADRKRLRLLCATNVGKAEKLKSGRINAQRRLSPIFGFNTKLTAKQETILLRSSRILGSVYPTVRTQEQLQDPHSARSRDDIVALPGNCYFKSFKEWQQNATVSEVDTEAAVFCAQSRLNDCSVVASICVAANWNMNFHESVLSRILADCSSNAEILFNVALHVNGTWRKIQVDDIMPFEEDTDKPLFVHCPRKLELMMPAILEKAYLTMFGTSASKGSNSASDLYYFTQWIPEFQTLRLPSWETRQLWKKILTAHGDGQVLLTTGTPRLSNDPDNVYKLIPNHNYAVIKLIENDNYRGLLLRNPWFQGIDTISTFEGLTDHLSQFQISEMDSSMFWLDWDMACNLFDMLYMNWNPGQFAYMSSLHFEYPNIFPLRPEECSQIGSLPQYLVRNDSDTTVRLWLLLEVHISECNPSESQISLLFSKSQSRIYHCLDKFDVSTTVLQSRFALLKTSLDAQSAGILIASLGSEAPSVRCSLTFYADFPVTVNAAPQTLPELLMEESRFRPLNYTFDNRRVVSIPQHTPVWKFSSTKPYRTVLSLQCDHPDIPIGIMVIIGDAQGKFTNVFSVDKVFQSTQRYLPRYNALHIDRTPLINLYICACVYGDVKIDMNFTLNVACEEKFSLTYIPPAIHGHFQTHVIGNWASERVHQFRTFRLTALSASLTHTSINSSAATLTVCVSIFDGDGQLMASSGRDPIDISRQAVFIPKYDYVQGTYRLCIRLLTAEPIPGSSYTLTFNSDNEIEELPADPG